MASSTLCFACFAHFLGFVNYVLECISNPLHSLVDGVGLVHDTTYLVPPGD